MIEWPGSPIQVLLNLQDLQGIARRAPCKILASTINVLPVFFLPNGSVGGVRERLLSVSEAGIASHLRRKGCVGDAALRGSDQGKPA